MIISIHQPNYFPWSGYFYKIMKSDIFVFLGDVNFSKNSFTNRTDIIENKEKVWITLPVKKKLGVNINMVEIDDDQWKKKHLSKIKNSYIRSDYFQEIWEKINLLFNSIDTNNLAEVNKSIIKLIYKSTFFSFSITVSSCNSFIFCF